MKAFFNKIFNCKNKVITSEMGTSFTLIKIKRIESSCNDYIERSVFSAILHISKGKKVLEIPLWFRKTILKKHANPKNKEVTIYTNFGVYSLSPELIEKSYEEVIKILSKNGADLIYIQKTAEELVKYLYL